MPTSLHTLHRSDTPELRTNQPSEQLGDVVQHRDWYMSLFNRLRRDTDTSRRPLTHGPVYPRGDDDGPHSHLHRHICCDEVTNMSKQLAITTVGPVTLTLTSQRRYRTCQ